MGVLEFGTRVYYLERESFMKRRSNLIACGCKGPNDSIRSVYLFLTFQLAIWPSNGYDGVVAVIYSGYQGWAGRQHVSVIEICRENCQLITYLERGKFLQNSFGLYYIPHFPISFFCSRLVFTFLVSFASEFSLRRSKLMGQDICSPIDVSIAVFPHFICLLTVPFHCGSTGNELISQSASTIPGSTP